MEQDKKDIKKWFKIISFALIGLLIVNNFHIVTGFVGKFFDIISPFVVGAALAFILNIPMKFFESKFSKITFKKGKKFFK